MNLCLSFSYFMSHPDGSVSSLSVTSCPILMVQFPLFQLLHVPSWWFSFLSFSYFMSHPDGSVSSLSVTSCPILMVQFPLFQLLHVPSWWFSFLATGRSVQNKLYRLFRQNQCGTGNASQNHSRKATQGKQIYKFMNIKMHVQCTTSVKYFIT